MVEQYLGPGFLVAAGTLLLALFKFNRSDAKEAVETGNVNTAAAMDRAREAEIREAEIRARLVIAEAEIARLHARLREAGISP